MKKIMFLFSAAFVSVALFGQLHYTKTGLITFDANTSGSPDKVQANNRLVTCVLNLKTGAIQFSAQIKAFEFEKALMQEHFNENYMESDRFPKAEFSGNIMNNASVNYAANGEYTVLVKGQLSIHGQTKDIQTEGKMVVNNDHITITSSFNVLLKDYNISIPALVADKISKTALISVNCLLVPLKNR